jgi:hypothetical protein
MNGHLDSDKSYSRDNEKVNGFLYIVFLALRIRFRILNILKEYNLLGKISVNVIIYGLS